MPTLTSLIILQRLPEHFQPPPPALPKQHLSPGMLVFPVYKYFFKHSLVFSSSLRKLKINLSLKQPDENESL